MQTNKAIHKILKSVGFPLRCFVFIYHSEDNPCIYLNISHLITECIKKTSRVCYLIAGPWTASAIAVSLKESVQVYEDLLS